MQILIPRYVVVTCLTRGDDLGGRGRGGSGEGGVRQRGWGGGGVGGKAKRLGEGRV